MKKNIFGRQFKRDINERKALFRSLATALVLQERIETTEQKAKAIKSQIEKLVTKAKHGGDAASHLLQPYLHADAVKKMLIDIAPRFQNRPGGYTRIIKVRNRFSDNARVVVIEWVEKKAIIADAPAQKNVRKATALEATTKPGRAKKAAAPKEKMKASAKGGKKEKIK